MKPYRFGTKASIYFLKEVVKVFGFFRGRQRPPKAYETYLMDIQPLKTHKKRKFQNPGSKCTKHSKFKKTKNLSKLLSEKGSWYLSKWYFIYSCETLTFQGTKIQANKTKGLVIQKVGKNHRSIGRLFRKYPREDKMALSKNIFKIILLNFESDLEEQRLDRVLLVLEFAVYVSKKDCSLFSLFHVQYFDPLPKVVFLEMSMMNYVKVGQSELQDK